MLCDAAPWAHQAEHLADIAEVRVANLTGQESIRAMAESGLMSAPPRSALNDGPLAQAIMDMAARVGVEAYRNQQRALMGRADGRADLVRISCPTLVLCGREDELTPLEVHVEMADAIPGADLVVLGKCGHLSPMERPEAVTSTLRGVA